jgi:hypothetical protein
MLSWYLLEVRHWSQGLTFICVLVGVPLVSVVEERLIVRPFFRRSRDNIGWFIATLWGASTGRRCRAAPRSRNGDALAMSKRAFSCD